ncbi:MAG TPA: polysaccharide biosynthesis/export family protein [Burkholderiaceae bacterium]|nr:polysaccharide biosynthesis/export family protein [Burkholderiaceae bacterium]
MRLSAPLLVFSALAGCANFGVPNSGPTRNEVAEATRETSGIQIVDVTDNVARQLLAQRRQDAFAESLGSPTVLPGTVAAGDVLEVSVWEAPPATLFGTTLVEARATAAQGSRPTTLPEQVVSSEGTINVPFAGAVPVAGRTLPQIEAEIARRLAGKANQPQVLVRLTRNSTANVTVVGEVGQSTRLPLTPKGERLLDALAAAGGVRQPVNKVTVQVTRGQNVYSMPLEAVIRDPRQNIVLQPGDVVTALFQPLSFTALGATGRNEEINFEAGGITLAQALARAGGLNDMRADSQGVFIFRLESANALAWQTPPRTTPDGRVPVVYRLDLKDPGSFFVAQSFPISNKDIVYVSNAPAAELQKFLNVITSVVYPAIGIINLTR